MFEEKKGRSDGLKLTQTSIHTLLRDRRRMHPATYLSTWMFRYEHFLFSSELNLDIQHYITPPTAGATMCTTESRPCTLSAAPSSLLTYTQTIFE
jgi:hypothetical protein